MKRIKIFVSHRIDLQSERPDNPIYEHMRCGAVFDSKNPMRLAGDDTGDNISERRMSFCEFTVQYWAWKNADLDYYGLCHYRRYLSFAPRRFRTGNYNMVIEPILTGRSQIKYHLLDTADMYRRMEGYDAIVSEAAEVSDIPAPHNRRCAAVRELWEAHDGIFLEKKYIDVMLRLIDTLAAEYSASAREYLSGRKHRGFNCFVMRKDVFFRLCEFQFPILFEIERRLDTSGYTQTMRRTPAFIGEMLYGIFVYHIMTREKLKVAELQMVFFQETARIRSKGDLVKRYALCRLESILRAAAAPVFPLGSYRREALKKLYRHFRSKGSDGEKD